jgi:sulfite exporter TauE/SafE
MDSRAVDLKLSVCCFAALTQINVRRHPTREPADMDIGLAAVANWCGAIPLSGGLLTGLLVAGLAGSPMHCVPMCGGFVLGQVSDRMARLSMGQLCEWRRLGAGMLLPYHLGRLSTYGTLGALAGALVRVPGSSAVSTGLLLLGATLLLMQALHRLAPGAGRWLPRLDRTPGVWNRVLARTSRGLDRSSALGSYLLGVTLGFLPCGFLYAALTTAAATGSPAFGAAGMLTFGMGTIPGLIAVGIGGHLAGRRWQSGLRRVSPGIILVNAGLLAVLAMQRFGAPG